MTIQQLLAESECSNQDKKEAMICFAAAVVNEIKDRREKSALNTQKIIEDIENYDINQDLKIVSQMTFSCDVINSYKIMYSCGKYSIFI